MLSRSPALSTSASDAELTIKNLEINPIKIEKPLDKANCAHADTKQLPPRLKLLLEAKKCTRKSDQVSEVKEIKKPDIRKKLLATKSEKNEHNKITSQEETKALNDDSQNSQKSLELEKRPVDFRKKLIQCKKSKQITTGIVKSEQGNL